MQRALTLLKSLLIALICVACQTAPAVDSIPALPGDVTVVVSPSLVESAQWGFDKWTDAVPSVPGLAFIAREPVASDKYSITAAADYVMCQGEEGKCGCTEYNPKTEQRKITIAVTKGCLPLWALMHELGHFYGLPHSDDRHSVMFTSAANPSVAQDSAALLKAMYE